MPDNISFKKRTAYLALAGSLAVFSIAARQLYKSGYNKGLDNSLTSFDTNFDRKTNYERLKHEFDDAINKRSLQIDQSLQAQLDKKFGKGLFIQLKRSEYEMPTFVNQDNEIGGVGAFPTIIDPIISFDPNSKEIVRFIVKIKNSDDTAVGFATLTFDSQKVYPSYSNTMDSERDAIAQHRSRYSSFELNGYNIDDHYFPLSETVSKDFAKLATSSRPARAAVSGAVNLKLEDASSVEFFPIDDWFNTQVLHDYPPQKSRTIAAEKFIKWAKQLQNKDIQHSMALFSSQKNVHIHKIP